MFYFILGTVFAYGITNSGKTYVSTDEEPGVIPKSIHDVFAWIEDEALDREFLLQVSYLEIYNEKIKDLLNSEQEMSSLEIRTHKNDVIVEGLKTLPVTTEKEVLDYIKKGQERRHISATDFNAQSSRSHTIFQLIIESKSKLSSLDPVRLSKLNLIDLAGSEKVASDLDRRHEGSHINKSLLTLGKVITSLINGSSHIPYRDSKLTRILQTSLSGNARVAVVCTINPDVGSKEESMNTLRFAQNVKKIETRPVITRV
ncbi:kinesin motor domain-containing protein [Cunninghamella echinulata]|nr:kinesin motor domain-containing protein [Cunninghamella echinulata]